MSLHCMPVGCEIGPFPCDLCECRLIAIDVFDANLPGPVGAGRPAEGDLRAVRGIASVLLQVSPGRERLKELSFGVDLTNVALAGLAKNPLAVFRPFWRKTRLFRFEQT